MGVGLIIVGGLVVIDRLNIDYVRLVFNFILVIVGFFIVGSLVKILFILMIVIGVCIFMVMWFSFFGVIF